MKRNRDYYPVQIGCTIKPIDGDGYQEMTNSVQGGLTVRDEVALRLFSALLANPIYPQIKVDVAQLRRVAISEADSFIAMLGEE